MVTVQADLVHAVLLDAEPFRTASNAFSSLCGAAQRHDQLVWFWHVLADCSALFLTKHEP